MVVEIPDSGRWSARPLHAALVRAVTWILPIASSVGFVYVASLAAHAPTTSLWLYLGWWLGLSLAATVVLLSVGRLSRRLLPLAALLRLSLVFPDHAPSRFRTAMQSGTVTSLEERLADAKRGGLELTPAEAARMLLVLVAALDRHDSLTRGHSERVRAYAQVIGLELGLGARDLDLLNWAALLHDVGKLELPRDILTKEGRPTDEEWAALRRHPELGEALVAPLREWLGGWCDAVGQHHERWDGRGYPRGMAGREISLAGRIVAVADVFDVITSSRSYKRASAITAGRAEIARCAGTQFDPEIVRAFLAVSLGRMRLVTGPFAWLAQAAVLARVPVTSAAQTLSAAAVAVTAIGSVGLVAPDSSVPVRPRPAAADPANAADTTLVASRGRAGVGGVTRDDTTLAVPKPGRERARAVVPIATKPASEPGSETMLPEESGTPAPRAAVQGSTAASSPAVEQSEHAGPSPAPPPPPVSPEEPLPALPEPPAVPELPPLPELPQVPGLPEVPIPEVELPEVQLPEIPEVPLPPVGPPVPPLPALPTLPPLPL